MLCSIENQNDLPSLKYSEDKNQESDLQCGDDQYEENDDERTSATPEEKRPKKKGGLSNKGRQLFCRKCEGHGTQVSLKGHTALCPYVNCQCKSCERLMRMRKSAFIRRYRTALSTTDPNEVNIKPIRLFENTNPRFAVAPPKEESNSAPHSETEEAQPFSFSNPSQLNLKFASTDQPSDTFPSSTNNNGR